MANDGHAAEGVYNVNVPGINSYPGNGANPNAQNANLMIQGWQLGQYQNQGRGPYGYNQVWYPAAGGNMMHVQPGYAYPSPPPATNMNMNMNGYNDGYYFNEPGSYGLYPLQAQPQFPLQPQPQPQFPVQPQPQPQIPVQPQPQPQLQPQHQRQPVFDAGRRGSSSTRQSGGRNSNTLQDAGRGRGRVFRDNNYNNEGERSTQLQGQGRVEPDEHAKADIVSRDYSNAKFFVIKSYSRENVVSSIKHAVWTSTRRGNKILNAAFRESRQKYSVNAILLFFSVEGSGNFCGVAEMDGPVDFEASADCWDRNWKGKFPVTWHGIKDVPYSQFQHITINTAESPNQISIIYSRDTQQVDFEKGVEMLDIFHKYVSTASLLDDVSKSNASPEQQQSQPPSPAIQQEEEQPEGKEKEKENGGENGCELYCTGTGSAICDINTNQIKLQDTIDDSPTDMQLQEILNILDKGMEMLDIFGNYVSTASLMDDVSKSTASPKQQQSQPPWPARQQQEQPEENEREKENGCELYGTGTARDSCDINTNQMKLQDTIKDSPNVMQLQEILNVFGKGMEMLDIFHKYDSTASLLDDVSKSTASAIEDSPNHIQLQEILNTDESTHLTTQQIANTDPETSELINIMVDNNCDTDETQQTDLDACMKLPKTTVDKEETHQSLVETSYEPERFAVDTDVTTQVNEDKTGDTNQNMTP